VKAYFSVKRSKFGTQLPLPQPPSPRRPGI